MLLPTEEAEQVERLATGHAVLWRTSGMTQTIVVPNCTAADVERIGAMIDVAESGIIHSANHRIFSAETTLIQPEISPKSARNPRGGSLGYSAAASGNVPSAEDARIVGLFLDGLEPSEIVTKLTGMKSSAGKPYQIELRRVQAAIRGALRR
jgi:hypothetical protein